MKNILIMFLLLTCGLCFGQNLVPNPSFEILDTCPDFPGQIYHITGWYKVENTPDLFHPCMNTSFPTFGVPVNDFTVRNAATGFCYCGIWAYTLYPLPEYRESIGVELTNPLTIGTRYYASMKVSSVNGRFGQPSNGAINKLGILFSTSKFDPSNLPPTNNYSQFYSDSIITDTIGWSVIKGSFIADSAYTFATLGNFFDHEHTDTIRYWYINENNELVAYYFIDDVCVTTDSLGCDFTSSIQKPEQIADVSLFPNPFSTQLTFSLADNEQTTVSLYNFLGQQVLQQAFTNSTTINTEQIPDGIYFYELQNSKGIIKTGKVVKQ